MPKTFRSLHCLDTPALMVWAMAACQTDVIPQAGVVRRDSAGIAIVESDDPKSAWQLALQPSLVIGAADRDTTQLVDGVVGAVVLSDGRIVIANRLPPMLRWYDEDGRFLHGIGRAGGGPGDLGGEGLGIGGLWALPGDSVAAWDVLRRRMQVFDAQGRYARAFSLQPPPGWQRFFAPRIIGVFQDTTVIAAFNVSAPPESGDRWRDTLRYALWRVDGEYSKDLAPLPGVESYTPVFQQRVRGTQSFGPPGAPPPPGPPPPFADSGTAVVSGNRWYYASTDVMDIHSYTDSTRPILILRPSTTRRAVTSAMKEAYARDWLDRGPNIPAFRQDMQRWLAAAVYPDSLPAYGQLLVAGDSSLWAQKYDAPGPDSVTWSILQRGGAWLSDITVPARLRILVVNGDNVVAVLRDELDVESVRVYRLRRGNRN